MNNGSDSTGELDMCKKHKLNVTVKDYTYPSLSKAIQQINFELNNYFNLKIVQDNISKNLAIKNVTNNNDMSNDITNVSSDNITMKKPIQTPRTN